MIEKTDSIKYALATIAILGQPPSPEISPGGEMISQGILRGSGILRRIFDRAKFFAGAKDNRGLVSPVRFIELRSQVTKIERTALKKDPGAWGEPPGSARFRLGRSEHKVCIVCALVLLKL